MSALPEFQYQPMQRVLALTEAGREEVRKPQSGLSLPQRWLLVRVDGQSSLDDLAAMATVSGPSDRLPRDAARLVAMGLAYDVGEPGPTSFGPSTQYGDITLALPLGEEADQGFRSSGPAGAGRSKSLSLWLAMAGLVVGAGGLGLWVLQRASAPAPGVSASTPVRTLPSALTPALMAASAALARAVAAPLIVRPLEPLPAAGATPGVVAAVAGTTGTRVGAPPAGSTPGSVPPPQAVTGTGGVATAVQPTAPAPGAADPYRATSPPPSPSPSPPSTTAAGPVPVVTSGGAVASPVSPPADTRPAPPDAGAARRGAQDAAGLAAASYVAPVAATPTTATTTQVAAAASPLPRTGSTALRPLSTVAPEYPRTALRESLSEDIVLKARLTVGPGGEVRQVDFGAVGLRERPFVRSARDAMLQWRFPEGTAERSYSTDVVFRREQ